MTGAFANAVGILLGSLLGLSWPATFSSKHQIQIRNLIGLLTILAGGRLIWSGLHGNFQLGMKELIVALLAVLVGNWIGRALALQKISNTLGRFASSLINLAKKNPPGDGGLLAATILFCAAPLGLIGAVTEGVSGHFDLLIIKAIMDGLAASAFVKIFRWISAMSAIPVYLFFGGITIASHYAATTLLTGAGLIESIEITAGLLACVIAVVIFETRKVELANYLPALAIAPLLTRWFGWG
jgi:uncharacterized membrane protein YqgA involved in biofilm formation